MGGEKRGLSKQGLDGVEAFRAVSERQQPRPTMTPYPSLSHSRERRNWRKIPGVKGVEFRRTGWIFNKILASLDKIVFGGDRTKEKHKGTEEKKHEKKKGQNRETAGGAAWRIKGSHHPKGSHPFAWCSHFSQHKKKNENVV